MEIVSGIGFGLLTLLGLCVVVVIHEAGHFAAARWAGVEVEAFAVGWGKVLWSWKPGKTEYRLCLLPLGGYCKMKGEQDLLAALEKKESEVEASPGSLFAAPSWKRIVISAAGPLANLATALVVFTLLSFSGVPSSGPEARLLLASEVDGRTGTAAEAAGLVTGDLVTAVGGQSVRSFGELQTKIAASAGQPMVWTVVRDGMTFDKTVVPRYDEAGKRPLVGVYPFNPPVVKEVVPDSPAALAGLLPGDRITSLDGTPLVADQVFYYRIGKADTIAHDMTVDRGGSTVRLRLVPEGPKVALGLSFVVPLHPARGTDPFTAVQAGAARTFDLLGQMVQGLARLFTGKEDPVQSLSGPISIVGQGSEAVSSAFHLGLDFGFSTLAGLLAFLSLALFLMNLLPIPALDGGSIVVSAIEGVRRKRLGLKALMAYQQAGALIVLGLILFTTLNDMGLFGKV